jgi:hypothetical protein
MWETDPPHKSPNGYHAHGPLLPLPEGWDEEQQFRGPGGIYEWALKSCGLYTEQTDELTDAFLAHARQRRLLSDGWLRQLKRWLWRAGQAQAAVAKAHR